MSEIGHHLPQPYTGSDAGGKASLITAASGTSFAAGMGILPADRRAGMHAVYAFCRQVDDVADGPWTADVKHRALDSWREEMDALYRGSPVSAVGQALLPAVEAYDLPKDEFLGMIDGMAMDAEGPIVAPSREELALYTRRVAGTVGVLSIRVFGAWKGDVSDRFALALGDALQLTNILRDVEEDADIGRLYLPAELLAKHGLAGASPDDVAQAEQLPAIREELGAEAEVLYNEARKLAEEHERKALRPALMMMGAYEGYLLRMKKLGWRIDPDAELLSKRAKLFRGLRYAFFGPGRPQTA
ncbi:squalene/phytoene synthase family protein [Parvularcula sp. ZS-1/3]|uniref:Squalene/phytoene synthase family protein n=1 Tax=Parvularcula mediterranea TaxID=2732508 RepID=A0A7Y3W4X4_9PROT|nr:squalene/phytoene synthase family protein [Parvularcula mediterranea]